MKREKWKMRKRQVDEKGENRSQPKDFPQVHGNSRRGILLGDFLSEGAFSQQEAGSP